ncbi:hypothetical protein LHJ74_09845 [Streptomyces sp. N2-109]|uniref:Uncharacterized protein n=1 Tax=Streptomyces gossypii TaxID=2883101 RepID=A0ABT2JQQ8_9ACTN|nr:hypothetical protein [Streptomyces gossypii]MCT2590211.1 hypothetical protein [Streptomyces gossypii]
MARTCAAPAIVGDVASFEYRFHLPRDPRAVGVTRTSVRASLTAHAVPELIDRAELPASELLTNALPRDVDRWTLLPRTKAIGGHRVDGLARRKSPGVMP